MTANVCQQQRIFLKPFFYSSTSTMTDEISRLETRRSLLRVDMKALGCSRDTQLMISVTLKRRKPAVKDDSRGHVAQVFLKSNKRHSKPRLLSLNNTFANLKTPTVCDIWHKFVSDTFS